MTFYFGAVRVKWVFLLRTAHSSRKMGERPINIGLFKNKNKNKNSECIHELINRLCWGVLNFFIFCFLNLFPLCSHQVPRGFHEVLKFPMCSQQHHTFIAYALPKVVLFSSILGGPNTNFQTLQSFNANQNGSLQNKKKLKFQGTPILIELN